MDVLVHDPAYLLGQAGFMDIPGEQYHVHDGPGTGDPVADHHRSIDTQDGAPPVVLIIELVDEVELSDVESGTGGFVINGVSADDQSGLSVSGAGDVNGDGLDDLIVGARRDDPNGLNSGASFVVFGKTDSAAVELSDIESGIDGFVIFHLLMGMLLWELVLNDINVDLQYYINRR